MSKKCFPSIRITAMTPQEIRRLLKKIKNLGSATVDAAGWRRPVIAIR